MLIQIVDDQDELIGVKERSLIDYDNDIYRVSALWLTNSKNQALLAKRSHSLDKDPGKWGPAVAGTLDEGESYDTNIYKEAEEEIGLTGEQFEKGPKLRVAHPRNYFCQWYFAQVNRDIEAFTKQESEVDELAWIDIEELKKKLEDIPDKYIPYMPQIIEELDTADAVELYVKLPSGFYINTPMGRYNPDWAIAFREGSVKHIYFVAETKGDTSDLQLREVERAKIECARRHFSKISDDNVKFGAASSYAELMKMVS